MKGIGIALLLGVSGCADAQARSPDTAPPAAHAGPVPLRLVTARDTIALSVELATTERQRNRGLMGRTRLAERAGMLFVYPSAQPGHAGFWMYRTRIPLDIAFLDTAGVVRAIRTMPLCPTPDSRSCPAYEPGVPFRYALEVNAGAFSRWRVATGDRLLLGDLVRRRQSARASRQP